MIDQCSDRRSYQFVTSVKKVQVLFTEKSEVLPHKTIMTGQITTTDLSRDMNDGFQRHPCMSPTYTSHSLHQLNKMQQVAHTPDHCTDKGSRHDTDTMLLNLEKRSRCLVPPTDAIRDGGNDQQGVEKPFHSYIALISMAILSSKEKKMLLNDIYQYIMDNFPYYNNNEKAWRNSIRHNLSLNECFVKCGRADNGKGHFWSIHPACIEDFTKGDFRRRHARRRAKRNGHRSEMDVSQMPISYRYNIGYVPMTPSSGLGYPYSSYFNSPSVGFRPSYTAQEQSPTPPMYHLGKSAQMQEASKTHHPYNMGSW